MKKRVYNLSLLLLVSFNSLAQARLDSATLSTYKQRISDQSLLIKLNPGNSLAYSRRAFFKDKVEDHAGAIDDYSKAIAYSPKEPANYYYRGVVFCETEQYDKAIADFSKTISLRPDLADTYLDRAVAFGCVKKYDRALLDIDVFIKQKPGDPRGYYTRADLDEKASRPDKALADYTRALLLDSGYYEAYVSRANIHLSYKKDYAQAIKDFSHAILLDSIDIRNYFGRAEAYRKLNQLGDAVDDYEKIILLFPNLGKALFDLADTFFEMKTYERALQEINRAIALDPAQPAGYQLRTKIYDALGQKENADKDRFKSKTRPK